MPDHKDEILIDYLEDRYAVDIATDNDVKAHVYWVDNLRAYDFVFASKSVSLSDTKVLKNGLIFESCEKPEYFK